MRAGRFAVDVAYDPNCIFCKIASGEISTDIVAQNERCLAFHDIDPKAPVHLLVIPRMHIESLNSLDNRDVAFDALTLCAEVAHDAGVAQSGYRVLTNTGPEGGQSVQHLHFHVLGGRQLTHGLG
jgi:histidine triad (HIT) family protein